MKKPAVGVTNTTTPGVSGCGQFPSRHHSGLPVYLVKIIVLIICPRNIVMLVEGKSKKSF